MSTTSRKMRDAGADGASEGIDAPDGVPQGAAESHDGAHVVSQPQVGEALRWFVEMSGTAGKSPPPSSFDQFFKKK